MQTTSRSRRARVQAVGDADEGDAAAPHHRHRQAHNLQHGHRQMIRRRRALGRHQRRSHASGGPTPPRGASDVSDGRSYSMGGPHLLSDGAELPGQRAGRPCSVRGCADLARGSRHLSCRGAGGDVADADQGTLRTTRRLSLSSPAERRPPPSVLASASCPAHAPCSRWGDTVHRRLCMIAALESSTPAARTPGTCRAGFTVRVWSGLAQARPPCATRRSYAAAPQCASRRQCAHVRRGAVHGRRVTVAVLDVLAVGVALRRLWLSGTLWLSRVSAPLAGAQWLFHFRGSFVTRLFFGAHSPHRL